MVLTNSKVYLLTWMCSSFFRPLFLLHTNLPDSLDPPGTPGLPGPSGLPSPPKADPPGLSFELYLRKWHLTKVVNACYLLINSNTEQEPRRPQIIWSSSNRSYLYGRAQLLWTMEVRVPTVATGLFAPERWTCSQLEYFLFDTWRVPLNDPILFHRGLRSPLFCPHLLQGWASLGEDVSYILYVTLN